MVRAVFVLSVALVCAGVFGCLSAGPTQEGTTTDEESVVYNAFFDYLRGLADEAARQKGQVFVVEDITSCPRKLTPQPPDSTFLQGNKVGGDLLTDYDLENSTPCKVRLAKRPGVTCHWISPDARERMFRYVAGKDPWREFHSKYKGACLLQFSRVGFNTERTVALVHVSMVWGDMGGCALYLLLHKQGETWRVVARQFSSVS